MPPKFGLQSVLDYRHARVNALEIELAELLHLLQQHQELLEKLKGFQVSLLIELSEKQMGEIDLFAMQHTRANIQLVEEKIAQVKAAIRELDVRVSAKRAEVVAARQGEETLKTLKTKENERFLLEQAQKEGKAVDDIYIAQAFQARRNGEVGL